MSKLTDMQLVILSAASQRDDRGVELPANVKGEGARKVVDKLIRAGLLEEVRASGSLPLWRRNDESGPTALCITQSGFLKLILRISSRTSLLIRSRPPSARDFHRQ